MNRPLRVFLQIFPAALFLSFLAIFDQVSVGSLPSYSLLRLTWRMTHEKVKFCRPYTAEETGQIPAHMRTGDELCRERLLPYALNVKIDGKEALRKNFHPTGARGDRPLSIQEDLKLKSGDHELEITFQPLPEKEIEWRGELSRAEEEVLEEAVERSKKFPLQAKISVEPGRIVLVTLSEQENLVVK